MKNYKNNDIILVEGEFRKIRISLKYNPHVDYKVKVPYLVRLSRKEELKFIKFIKEFANSEVEGE